MSTKAVSANSLREMTNKTFSSLSGEEAAILKNRLDFMDSTEGNKYPNTIEEELSRIQAKALRAFLNLN